MDLIKVGLLGRLNSIDMFVIPNMLQRPEVYTFTKGKKVFVLESHGGGILAHAHALVETFPDKMDQVKGAKLYFTMEKEYSHSHPDTSFVYYVAKKGDGSNTYVIYELNTQKEVTSSKMSGGHWHGLSVKEVIEL